MVTGNEVPATISRLETIQYEETIGWGSILFQPSWSDMLRLGDGPCTRPCAHTYI